MNDVPSAHRGWRAGQPRTFGRGAAAFQVSGAVTIFFEGAMGHEDPFRITVYRNMLDLPTSYDVPGGQWDVSFGFATQPPPTEATNTVVRVCGE